MTPQSPEMTVATRPPETALAWLSQELPQWTRDGLLTEDQASRIRLRYDFREIELDRHAGPGRLVAAVSIMGALLFGAGVLTFIASNWEEMPDALRLAMIFAGVIGFQWGGYELAFRRGNHPYVGQALLLIGALTYGASIFLVAQIFHLDEHYPNGFLLWGVGALAVAIAVDSVPVFAVAAAALAVWSGSEAVGFEKNHLLGLGVLIAGLLPLAYLRRKPAHLTVAVLGLASWFVFGPVAWAPHDEEQLLSAWFGAAALFLAVGGLHTSAGAPEHGLTWRTLAIFASLFLTWLLGFHELAEEVAPRTAGEGATGWHAALLVAGAAAAGLAALRARDSLQRVEAVAAAVLAGFGLLWLTVASRDTAMILTLAFNLAFFAGAVGLVALGCHERRARFAYQGLAWFGIGLFSRYVEYGYDLVDKSLFFIVGGLLLLGVGWALEKQRRRIAATLREARP